MTKKITQITVTLACAFLLFTNNLKAQNQGCDSLTTTYNSNNNNTGSMFSIITNDDIQIQGIYTNIYTWYKPTITYGVYYKKGSYLGFEQNAKAWTFVDSVHFPKGINKDTARKFPFKLSLDVKAKDTISIYIQELASNNGFGRIYYTIDTAKLGTVISDKVISILPGMSHGKLFGPTKGNANHIWNGSILYCQSKFVNVDKVLNNNTFNINTSNQTLTINLIETISDKNLQVSIYDMLSRPVLTEQLNASVNTFSTSHLAKGIYICNVLNNNTILQQKKIVIE